MFIIDDKQRKQEKYYEIISSNIL